MQEDKVLDYERARQRAEELRACGRKVATVNGAFDLLHAGHLAILEEAKAQGDVLFVGINSDASIRQYKGPQHPVVPQAERMAMIAALASVDYVVLIDAPEAGAATIELIRPDVHVNGSEYGPPEQWVEYPVMEKYGVRGHACSRRPGFSTTDLLERILVLTRER